MLVIGAQYRILKTSLQWDVTQVSNRYVELPYVSQRPSTDAAIDSASSPGRRIFSGHSGEWMAVMTSAWGAFLRLGLSDLAAEATTLLSRELEETAQVFHQLRQRCVPNATHPTAAATNGGDGEDATECAKQLLQLSAIMTHNAGDIDQGLTSWAPHYKGTIPAPHWGVKGDQRRHALLGNVFRRLAHEQPERYGGAFCQAKDLYKDLLSNEGHRNYPLREARCLRRSQDLQLPQGECCLTCHLKY